MSIRYFHILSPRVDFTGHVGGIAFADGLARVSFDDDPAADEPRVQVGRSAVLFARRRKDYIVTEVDAAGQPLPEEDPKKKALAAKKAAAQEAKKAADPDAKTADTGTETPKEAS